MDEVKLEPTIEFLKVDLTFDLKTVSEANATGEHWTAKSKRHKAQKLRVLIELMNNRVKVELPCIIKLSRLSPRLLDSDNLQSAFKHIRDQIAEYIFPEKKTGQADNDPRLTWLYDQEKSKIQKIRIQIYY